jgi:hypothetical protein
MIQASEMVGGHIFPGAAKRSQSRAGTRVVSVETALSIGANQMRAWAAFAETLAANARRLDDVDGRKEHPFGQIQARLAACNP